MFIITVGDGVLSDHIVFVTAAEYGVEYRALLFLGRAEMHRHIVVFLAEEKNVGLKHESHISVEFEHGVEPAFQKSSERTEFLFVLDHYFHVIYTKPMVRTQQLYEVGEIQVFLVLAGLVVAFVNFVYDFLCYHIGFKM